MTFSLNRSKLIRSLSSKKNRIELGLFVAEGKKTVRDLLHSNLEIDCIYLSDQAHQIEFPEAEIISAKDFVKISSQKNPDGVLAVFKIPRWKFDRNLISTELIPVLDGISDPGNLGTMLRIADWFGHQNVICSLDTVDAFNSKCVQASMGSVGRIKVHYLSLPDFLKELPGETPIIGTVLNGDNIYAAQLATNGLVLFGSESHGIRPEITGFIQKKLTIPSFGKAESLNAAMAMAITCSEFKRRSSTPQR